MKQRPKDLLDNLKTGEDKVALVNEVKKELRAYGYRVKVVRRKLANGEKLYFEVTGDISLEDICNDDTITLWGNPSAPEVTWGDPFRNRVRQSIQERFPNIRMTSASSANVTFAEY